MSLFENNKGLLTYFIFQTMKLTEELKGWITGKMGWSEMKKPEKITR
jgi:hypothetical protein